MSNLNYKFFYWGPLLIQTRIDDALRLDLLAESKNASLKFDHTLSKLENEYSFNDSQVKQFSERLKPYFDMYRHVYETNWNLGLIDELKIKTMWVNFQTQNEWRPPHFHSKCDASFVIYLDVPKVEPIEENVYGEYKPGGIVFKNFTKAQYADKLKSIDIVSHLPESGDMFIFPYSLEHYSVPFKTQATRISISGNLTI